RQHEAGEERASNSPESLIGRLLPSQSHGQQPPVPDHYRHKLGQFLSHFHRPEQEEQAPVELGMFELFARSLDTVQETITRLKVAAQPRYLQIRIPRNACAFYEFHRAADLMELGYERSRETLARWQPPGPTRT